MVEDLIERSDSLDAQRRANLLDATRDLRSTIGSASDEKLEEWNRKLMQCIRESGAESASELSQDAAANLANCITNIRSEASQGFWRRLFRR
jgi:hypothetical protein